MTELKNKLVKIKPLHGELSLINTTNDVNFESYALRTILANDFKMPNYQSKKNPSENNKKLNNIHIYSTNNKDYIKKTKANHLGNGIARFLAMMPISHLRPKNYYEILEKLSEKYHWQFKAYTYEELKKMGAGAFCAVGRASPDQAFIFHLKYKPKIQSKLKLSLVGKGICFDTGGVSLKAPQYMYNMHEDMQGSSVALGNLVAITEKELPIEVDLFLAVTENLIGENAFLPNEVVTTLKGISVETTDTDAEGRMVLADTLYLASKEKPQILIDFATLTGAAVRAISTRYSVLVSNQKTWLNDLIHIGDISAERAWPMPLFGDDFSDVLHSDIADIKQCLVTGNADHLMAAYYLYKFIDDQIKWIHLDLAASTNEGGLGAIPSTYTGFGVWWSQYFIDHLLKEKI